MPESHRQKGFRAFLCELVLHCGNYGSAVFVVVTGSLLLVRKQFRVGFATFGVTPCGEARGGRKEGTTVCC